jgi:hypothetical protein
VTTPWEADPSNINRVIWAPSAANLWRDIRLDKPLPKPLLAGSLNAHHIPGVTKHRKHPKNSAQQRTDNLSVGLCA